jgi:hypothetical protein
VVASTCATWLIGSIHPFSTISALSALRVCAQDFEQREQIPSA